MKLNWRLNLILMQYALLELYFSFFCFCQSSTESIPACHLSTKLTIYINLNNYIDTEAIREYCFITDTVFFFHSNYIEKYKIKLLTFLPITANYSNKGSSGLDQIWIGASKFIAKSASVIRCYKWLYFSKFPMSRSALECLILTWSVFILLCK